MKWETLFRVKLFSIQYGEAREAGGRGSAGLMLWLGAIIALVYIGHVQITYF
jgi:hypothetical protein